MACFRTLEHLDLPSPHHPDLSLFLVFLLFQASLALTDKPLLMLTSFLSTGTPNSTSGPPWITNASTLGPQSARCLIYAVFLLAGEVWALLCVRVEAGNFIDIHWCPPCFVLQTLPQDKLHLCGWYSREPPPQTADQDAEPGNLELSQAKHSLLNKWPITHLLGICKLLVGLGWVMQVLSHTSVLRNNALLDISHSQSQCWDLTNFENVQLLNQKLNKPTTCSVLINCCPRFLNFVFVTVKCFRLSSKF